MLACPGWSGPDYFGLTRLTQFIPSTYTFCCPWDASFLSVSGACSALCLGNSAPKVFGRLDPPPTHTLRVSFFSCSFKISIALSIINVYDLLLFMNYDSYNPIPHPHKNIITYRYLQLIYHIPTSSIDSLKVRALPRLWLHFQSLMLCLELIRSSLNIWWITKWMNVLIDDREEKANFKSLFPMLYLSSYRKRRGEKDSW